MSFPTKFARLRYLQSEKKNTRGTNQCVDELDIVQVELLAFQRPLLAANEFLILSISY